MNSVLTSLRSPHIGRVKALHTSKGRKTANEFLAEGPMGKKGKASFLVMGRYSTLSLFNKLGIKIGTDAVPVYGDAAFKFNWVLKNNAQLSFFGIGGKSEIAIKISDQKENMIPSLVFRSSAIKINPNQWKKRFLIIGMIFSRMELQYNGQKNHH